MQKTRAMKDACVFVFIVDGVWANRFALIPLISTK
jgi:hypothetical protein